MYRVGYVTIMQRILAILALIFVLDFASFWDHALYLGGDAFNGKIVDDHYFVGIHGSFSEVSEMEYIRIKFHAISVFACLVANMVVGLVAFAVGVRNGKTEIAPRAMQYAFVLVFAAIVIGDVSKLTWLSKLAWFSAPLPFVVAAFAKLFKTWDANKR